MGEVLKFVTSDGGLRKKTQKIFAFFFLRPPSEVTNFIGDRLFAI